MNQTVVRLPAPTSSPSGQRYAFLSRDALFRRSLAVADVCAVLGSLFIAVVLVQGLGIRWPAAVTAPLFILAAKAIGLYDRDANLLHKTTVDEIPTLFGLATFATLVFVILRSVIVSALGPGAMLALWGSMFFLLIALRALARAFAGATQPPERCLVLGDPEDGQFLEAQIGLAPTVRAEVVATMPLLDVAGNRPQMPPDLAHVLVDSGIDRVIVARPPGALEGAEGLLDTLRRLKSYGVKITLLPRGPRVAGPAVELDQLPGVTLLALRGLEISRSSRIVKRAFDLVGSVIGLIVLSPLLAVIALAIRLDSPGSVVFRQRRVGRGGREFMMLKFRSMVSEAEQRRDELQHLNEGGPGLFKITGDPRVTRVGRILRRLSLDELPQLVNVVRGEMSLVGPRPLVPEEDSQIEGRYRRRLEVRPGMTGHWQILHNSRRIPLDEMVKLDYLYVANWTLWNDIRLLIRTVPFVVGARGI